MVRIDVGDWHHDATASAIQVSARLDDDDSTSANMQLNAVTPDAQALGETKHITQPPRRSRNVRVGQLRNDRTRRHRTICWHDRIPSV
jgi:hypothetical protein